MRRISQLLALLFLLAAAVAVPASGALAQSSGGSASAEADFDNDGFADLAVGVPGENGNAGAVNVLYGAGAV
jgi:hypothetical protein